MVRKKSYKRSILAIAVVILSLAFPILFSSNDYIIRVGVFSEIYVLLAISLNLISGVAGQISMGHVAFYALGAYASALLSTKAGWPFLLCLVGAVIVSAIGGVIIGIPSLRLQGGYLAIITIGFAEVVRLTLLNWIDFTRGALGIVNIARPEFFGFTFSTNTHFWYLILVFIFLSYFILQNLIQSRFGRNLKAIKNDEIAAEAMGINVYRHKVIAFVVSAAIAGIAGSLFAHYMLYIAPANFTSDQSTIILSMVVLGGLGSMPGAVVAAIVLTALPESLRDFSKYRMLVYGFLLIVIMLSKTTAWSETRIGLWLSQKFHRRETPIVSTEEGGVQ